MAQRRRLIFELDITDTDTDTIRGRVIGTGGQGADFVGWLGLAGAIENQLQLPDVCVRTTEMPDPRTLI